MVMPYFTESGRGLQDSLWRQFPENQGGAKKLIAELF
jgi:hypothetical protein